MTEERPSGSGRTERSEARPFDCGCEAALSDSGTLRHGARTGLRVMDVVTAVLLVLSILGLTLSTLAAIRSVDGDPEELHGRDGFREMMRKLEEDLALSSSGADPRTGRPRFEVFTDANGRQAIRYQKLTGARMVGRELQPSWSDFVEVRLTPGGTVTRTAGGETTVLGTGIADLTFAVTPAGRFRVFCTTRHRDAVQGHIVEQTYEEFIVPKN